MGTNHIKIHDEDSVMFKKSDLLASALRLQDKKATYHVDTCYFDFGQNWLWTTIIAERRSDGASYQALYPVQQEKLYNAETFSDIMNVIGEIVNEVVKE